MAVDAKTINIHMTVTGNYVSEMAARGAATQTFGNQAHAGMSKAQIAMARVGSAFATFGKISALAIAGGLLLSAKAAITFESSFAGVRKTVEATEPEFERLAMGIRDMAKEIPIGVNELNRIAELGGQLGVDVGGIETFTETIAKLGVTTTLSTEAAATGLARLDNIMGTNQMSFEATGSALVQLGNNFAATEDEILTFTTRIAPIGATMGMTTDEVLAIATAFTSVGIPAERGGTAVQKTLIGIASAADLGGQELETFARITNMTAGEFQNLVKSDPTEAFRLFVNGLGDIVDEGGNVTGILQTLGLSNQRVIGSLLALANAEGVLDDALQQSNQAFIDQTALSEEAEKRFETTASQLIILKNNLVDAGIAIGQDMLPRMNGFITGLGDIFDWIRNLHPALQGLIGVVSATSAAFFLMKSHPVVLALTGVAFLISEIGMAAEFSRRQTELLYSALERDPDLPNLSGTELQGLFDDEDLLTVYRLGFSPENLSDAIFRDDGTEALAIAQRLKEQAFSELNDAQIAQLEQDKIYDEYEGTLQDYYIAAGTFGKTAGLIGRIEGFAKDRKRIQEEIQAAFEQQQEIDFIIGRGLPGAAERQEHRDRFGLIKTGEEVSMFANLTEDQLGLVEDALGDYTQAFIDAFDETSERIMGQVSLWYDFGDAIVINVAKMRESLTRQVDAVIAFENFFLDNNLSDELEGFIRRNFGDSPALQEAFINWYKLDPAAAEAEFAIWETQLGRLGVLIDNILEARLPELETLSGIELLEAFEAIVDEILEADPSINPIAAWNTVLAETALVLPEEKLNSIKGLLIAALASPELLTKLDLTKSQLLEILDALNALPSVETTDVIVNFEVRGDFDDWREWNDRWSSGLFKVPDHAPARAFGGSVVGQNPYIVGEHGPELFVPFNAGMIVPNSKLGGEGDKTINLTIVRPETNDLPGDISEGLTRASIAEQIDLIGAY